jgi:2'-hydroxyisoflavone reductase
MKLLLLGGYRFLGRAVIEAAMARGHAVTAFNRGNQPALPDLEEIRGDRDDPRALAGQRWDAVVDTSGYIPRHVREAAEVLRDNVGTYVFVSTLSVYKDPMPPTCDESAPRKILPEGSDPNGSDLTGEAYGAKKALCEDALQLVMPGRNVAVRPGFIIGPNDYTDRFNSWVERASRSQPFLLPGDPDAPLQLIDVRDIATWIVCAAETRLIGAYNVTAPAQPYTAIEVARACLTGTNSRADIVVVGSDVAKAAGLVPWEHIPFWMEPEIYSVMQMNIDCALATGLSIRPLFDTVRDTYSWLQTTIHPRAFVCPPELEAATIAGAATSHL